MASVIKVNGKWRAQVRRKGSPALTKTFSTKALARSWASQLEDDIERRAAGLPLKRSSAFMTDCPPLAETNPTIGSMKALRPITQTELLLLTIHQASVVMLVDICVEYLQLGRSAALRQASLNRLPFPTFRLSESRKAPVLVTVEDLAAHIDEARDVAKAAWQHSQL